MVRPHQKCFVIIRTGNPTSRFRPLKQHGSEDSSMQFRRHPWHNDPALRHEELDEDDEDKEHEDDDADDDDDLEDDEDDDEDDEDDFDEDDERRDSHCADREAD